MKTMDSNQAHCTVDSSNISMHVLRTAQGTQSEHHNVRATSNNNIYVTLIINNHNNNSNDNNNNVALVQK